MLMGAMFLVVPARLLASGGGSEGKFNAGEMIIHHIQDAHSIHLVGDLTLPLPCIVKTEKGWDFFSSAVFMDEHHGFTRQYFSNRTGNTYALVHEQITVVEGTAGHRETAHTDPHLAETAAGHGGVHAADSTLHAATASDAHTTHSHGKTVTDFSITKSVLGMLLMLALVVFLFVRMARAYQKRRGQAPKGMQNLLESLVLFIKDEVAIPALGKKKAMRYLPFMLTAFFFIWACNLLGLVPFSGGFNITGTLSVTLVLATMVFVITAVSGNAHYWGHILWPPGVPLLVKMILVPIEIMGVLMKPTVLMIRLTANINAGHIVILAFTSLIFIFAEKSGAGAGYGVGIGATLFMIFMYFIELLVAFLQAYVFTLLAALYFGDATQEHHHEEAHH